MREQDIQNTILEYLKIKKVFHYRNNSGAMVSEYKGKQRFMRFGTPGSPDIICVIGGRYIGIEVKKPKGVLNTNQKAFGAALEQAGGVYLVARSLGDVIQFLNTYGKNKTNR